MGNAIVDGAFSRSLARGYGNAIVDGAFSRSLARGNGNAIPSSASTFADVALEAPAVLASW